MRLGMLGINLGDIWIGYDGPVKDAKPLLIECQNWIKFDKLLSITARSYDWTIRQRSFPSSGTPDLCLNLKRKSCSPITMRFDSFHISIVRRVRNRIPSIPTTLERPFQWNRIRCLANWKNHHFLSELIERSSAGSGNTNDSMGSPVGLLNQTVAKNQHIHCALYEFFFVVIRERFRRNPQRGFWHGRTVNRNKFAELNRNCER
jgi:hypothetical protein